MRCVADVPWNMEHGPWILGCAANDSAGLRGELCALPATDIAERCFLTALKLPRLTRDLLSMSVSDTALRVDPLLEGCRGRYDTRRSTKPAFATLFALDRELWSQCSSLELGLCSPDLGPSSLRRGSGMPHLRPSFADLENRPLVLGAMQQASVTTVLTRCTVGRVPDRVDPCLQSSTLYMDDHPIQLLTP